jgi:hypothetical protein
MAYKVQVVVPILCSTILDVFPVVLFYRTASTLPAVAFPKKRTAFSAKLWLYCFNEGQTAYPFSNLGTPRCTGFSFCYGINVFLVRFRCLVNNRFRVWFWKGGLVYRSNSGTVSYFAGIREAGSYFTSKERIPHAPGLRSWARIAVETYRDKTRIRG